MPEMYYKRKNPAASFQPYAYLLTAWLQGTDNVPGSDFGLYSSLSDAIEDTNEYTSYDFSDSG